MSQIDEEIDNQSSNVDVEQNDGEPNNSGSSDDGDFLVVNERTRFKTQDDAIRSYNEAGERIKQLSAWEKELNGRYGVRDPQTAAALFEELKQLRAEKAEAAKKIEQSKESVSSGKSATTHTEDEVLSVEDQQALAWLKKFAPRLGFVPKDELQQTVDALKAEVAELKSGSEASSATIREEQFMERVDSGRQSVRGWMTEQKIVDDADNTKLETIENLITAWVNKDQERIDRFNASMSSSQALIKEGFERAIKVLGWGKSGTAAAGNSGSADYARNKGQSMQRNGKRLPQQGTGSGKKPSAGDGVRVDAGGRKDHIGSVHDAAWQIAQKHFSGTSAE